MKKITLALMAVMLVLGMTQCKKEQPTPTPDPTPDGETVYISMKVDDGGKHIVYPGTGAYVFEDGDKIYVGNNGHYVGTLTYGNGTFSGSITSPSTSDYLHFYFTGGKAPADAPTAGSTTSFTVNISDQTSKLPILSYGRSHIKYVDGTTAYSCMLENQCGLVKFVPTIATPEVIRVGGMKTTATINFATGSEGIEPVDATTGAITLYSVSDTEKWAILLPQNEVTSPTVNVGNYSCTMTSTITTIPAVGKNMYHSTGISVRVPGKFRLGTYASEIVYISPGNLQYIGSAASPYWKFADNQWDVLSNDQTSEDPNIDRDRFCWGTSGWNNGNLYYQPYNRSYNTGDEAKGYGYGPTDGTNYEYNLTGDYVNADWGVYNAITNGGNQAGLWRTMDGGGTLGILRYNTLGLACVNDVNGLVILPIDWHIPDGLTFTAIYEPTYTEYGGITYVGGNHFGNFSDNIYSADQWLLMESYGAIFLPCTVYQTSNSMWYGSYWGSTAFGPFRAYFVNFNSNGINNQSSSIIYRYRAHAVRLVQSVQ